MNSQLQFSGPHWDFGDFWKCNYGIILNCFVALSPAKAPGPALFLNPLHCWVLSASCSKCSCAGSCQFRVPAAVSSFFFCGTSSHFPNTRNVFNALKSEPRQREHQIIHKQHKQWLDPSTKCFCQPINVQGKKFSCAACVEQLHSCCPARVPRSVNIKKTGRTQSLDLVLIWLGGLRSRDRKSRTQERARQGPVLSQLPQDTHAWRKQTDLIMVRQPKCAGETTLTALCFASTHLSFSLLLEKKCDLFSLMHIPLTRLKLHSKLSACFRRPSCKKLSTVRSAAQEWHKIIRTVKTLAYSFQSCHTQAPV